MGAEANGHCLSGELVIIFETSDEVTGKTTSRAGVERRAMEAGDEFRVTTDGDESSLEMAENVPNVGRRRTTGLAATKRHTPYMLFIVPQMSYFVSEDTQISEKWIQLMSRSVGIKDQSASQSFRLSMTD